MTLIDLIKKLFTGLTPEQESALWTILMVLVVVLIAVIIAIFTAPNLNSKAKKVGDGQHGDARWITDKEKKKAFPKIEYNVKAWRSGNLPDKDKSGIIIDMYKKKNKVYAYIETHDVHVGMYAGSGAGKTAFFLYPNLEYACATGVSFFTTDTKGDLYRNYGYIAKYYYGYNVSVLDLRNPIISTGNNILAQVNKYMDIYKNPDTEETERLPAKAKAEKYASLIAENIVKSNKNENYGANSYFYDAANGLLTATILLVSEYGNADERHIASVFTLLTELLEPVKSASAKEQEELLFNRIIRPLPTEHRAKLFATAAIKSSDNTKMSVVTTALTKLISFIDSEIEQMLCFENEIDIEKFCAEKSAVFIVLPEEDSTKYFLVSLLVQQFYRECLMYADGLGGKLPKRAIFFLDEIGTVPKIESFDMMFSAARSRNIIFVPILQSPSQLEDKYGDKAAKTINSNIACVMYGGFSPESELAKDVSKALGNVTVTTTSISKDAYKVLGGHVQNSMTGKPLISENELNRFKTGDFIVRRSGQYPMRVRFELFLDWGITFPEQLLPKDKKLRIVKYLKAAELEERINVDYPIRQQQQTKTKRMIEKDRYLLKMLNTPADSLAAAVNQISVQNQKSDAVTTKKTDSTKGKLPKKAELSV